MTIRSDNIIMETDQIIQGDARNVLADMDSDSAHAVVTDPPYGLAFMGRSWDDFDPREYQDWCEQWSKQALDVLKPGGHLLAFSGNRTHHRLFSGVEDAGFEIRDVITWHYGSGFPKALDVSKSIDKQADAERTEGKRIWKGGDRQGGDWSNADRRGEGTTEKVIYDEPATDAAEKWDGFKTALKPATEFVVVARAPLSEGTVAENVQTHGTGALNIDECRVGTDVDTTRPDGPNNPAIYGEQTNDNRGSKTEGRYPSNVVFDEQAAEALDRSNDKTVSTGGVPNDGQKDDRHDWAASVQNSTGGLGDSGGVSRYFYTSKATKAERTLDGKIANAHPTVKPTDLMEWLVKLVTAEGQTVLDPFCGTGTTCRAAKDLNREFIGIEQQRKWADVARVRCGLTPDNPAHLRADDDAQTGLESYAGDD